MKPSIYYDEEADYFEMFFGTKRRGTVDELKPGIFRKVDPTSGKTIGIGILNFRKRARQNRKLVLSNSILS
ncbi:MAG: DUF2283 domain-containing protein [Nanoarchaeota archaeon]|nr:MAG: DUF2283 domain-containing protein [Nanoarchaeota archaeon]